MDSVFPAHRCTSPLGVVPVGLGDGVGHCRDAANLSENGPFISLGLFCGGSKLCLFSRVWFFILVLLLNMLVAKREPAPCYHDACLVGIPKGAYGGKSGQNHCKTTVSPRDKCVFLVSKRTLYFSGRWWYGCCILVGLGILGLVGGLSFLVNYLSSSPILVSGFTCKRETRRC